MEKIVVLVLKIVSGLKIDLGLRIFLFGYSENFLVSDFFRYCVYSMSAIRLNRWFAMQPQNLIPPKAQLFYLGFVFNFIQDVPT